MTDAIVMTRGDDRTLQITAYDKNGDLADLTDVDLRFTAKISLADPDARAVLYKTRAGGGISVVGDPTDGVAEVALDAADTASLLNGQALFWDLQSKLPPGGGSKVTTLASGVLIVKADVTRSTA